MLLFSHQGYAVWPFFLFSVECYLPCLQRNVISIMINMINSYNLHSLKNNRKPQTIFHFSTYNYYVFYHPIICFFQFKIWYLTVLKWKCIKKWHLPINVILWFYEQNPGLDSFGLRIWLYFACNLPGLFFSYWLLRIYMLGLKHNVHYLSRSWILLWYKYWQVLYNKV